MQVEENTAVRCLGNRAKEEAVRHFTRQRAEIVHAGLKSHGTLKMGAGGANIIGCDHDALRSLNRRQQQAGKEVLARTGDTIEAEMIADPWRSECVDRVPKRAGLLLIEGRRLRKGQTHAVNQLGLPKLGKSS